jgi:hypothetical protein
VPLDSVDQQDAVAFGSRLVDEDIDSACASTQRADIDRTHDRADGVVNAVAGEHLPLPFGGAAAVTSHRRKDKGLEPHFAQTAHGSGNNFLQVRDPAASRCHGDARARLQASAKSGTRHLPADRGGNIADL